MLIAIATLSAAFAQDPTTILHGQGPGLSNTQQEPAPIINGANADRDEYPMTGGMLMSGTLNLGGSFPLSTFVCSSTLIAPDVVLLAAHCIDDTAFTFGIGTIDDKQLYWTREPDLTDWDGSQTNPSLPEDAIEVLEAVLHPDFSLQTLATGIAENNDIALLFLAEAVTDVTPAYLPTSNEADQVNAGKDVDVVGWGQQIATGFFEQPPAGSYAIKMMGTSTIAEVGEFEFHVGKDTEEVRKCHGDSGGPSFMTVSTDSSNKIRLVGVTSHAYDETDCNETGGVDTRVDAFLNWIDEEMIKGCTSGVRVSCEIEGIIPPPSASLADEEGSQSGSGPKGCSSLPAAPGALLALFGGLVGWTRRRI